jgi:hypothetical protein
MNPLNQKMKTRSMLYFLFLPGFLLISTAIMNNAVAQNVMKVQSGAVITVQNGAELNIQGGINFDDGSILNNAGIIRLVQNGANGAADWIDNTVTAYHYGTGKVILNGTGGHLISSKNTFQQIDVDAGGNATLGSDILANKWYLKTGKVITSSFKAIALGAAQLSVEADPSNINFASSWFNGNLRRFITPATVNTYTFPVGDAAKVNRAVMENLTATSLTNLNYIDASFGPKPGNDVGLIASENGQYYISVNNGGVWYLTPDAVPSAGKYDLLLYFNGFSGLSDNMFTILRRPDASSAAVDWVVPAATNVPSSNLPGRTVSSGFARRNNIGTFSQFGLGQLSSPLPVTLMDFDARRLSKLKVQVNWQTLFEQNNHGFEVERRLDGESVFTTIGFVLSKAENGNSNRQIDYTFTDANGYAGISYYRLKQVDKDARFTYTHIKAVKGMGETQVSVMLFPNPNKGQFTIRLDGVNRSFDGVIMDVNGKIVKQVRLSNNNNIDISGLTAGTYLISIPDVFGPGESFTEKVLVIK